MSLTCQVQLVINSVTGGQAGAIRRALEPDNIGFPKGLSLGIENVDDRLVLDFKSEGDMGHLVGTVDEVLGHVQAALGAIEC